MDALDSRIFRGAVVLFCWGLVPIEDATDKGRDEESTSFGSGDSLRQREQKCKIAVNAVVFLQNLGSLYSLPGWGQLDQNSILADANFFIELRKFIQHFGGILARSLTYFDDVKGLVDGCLSVKRKSSIDLSGDSPGDNLQYLVSKFDKQSVQSGINLIINIFALSCLSASARDASWSQGSNMLLAILNGNIDQWCILWFLRRS